MNPCGLVRPALMLGLVALLALFPTCPAPAQAVDPFADLTPATASGPIPPGQAVSSRRTRTFLKKELVSQFSWQDGAGLPYSRQLIGGEILQRYSDDRRTWGSFNVQGRLVHRERFLPVSNDMEGEERNQWFASL